MPDGILWTFPDADRARLEAARASDIMAEIHALEDAIRTAVDAGSFSTLVTGTVMAGDPVWFDVWAGTTTDPERSHAMDSVIRHFERLGYTIVREQDPANPGTFRWRVTW